MTVAAPVLRPVRCVIDHLHRDRAVADDARAGRFTHAGETLTVGRRPDWRTVGLADDEEWRIEFVKLYEGLDLAHAYVETGERDHLAAWEDLVDSFCDQIPVGHDSSDVSARRIQNWIYAWQRAEVGRPGTALAPGLAERLVARLAADVAHLRDHLTAERNHRTLELYALLVAALALPDELDHDGSLARWALDALADNAANDLCDDGVQRERSSDYHLIVLRSYLGALANARAACLTVDPAFVARVGRACDVALHLQRPDGLTPSLSDGDTGDFADVLALGADLYGRDDLRWAATRGRAGRAPRVRHATFAEGGYAVQRSGWGDGDVAYDREWWSVIDVGPLGDGGHGHYDQLSVELMASGHLLAVDPGRYTYADSPWRRWFKGTAAHNTVTVDGFDQTPYRRGKPKGPVSSASLLTRRTGDGPDALDAIVGRVHSPVYDAVHTRRLLLVPGLGWVVHDQLRAPTDHRYELRWHLAPDVLGAVELTTVGAGTAEAGILVTTPSATWLLAGVTDAAVSHGLVSPTYGVKHAAPVIVARAAGADADLLTVVTPAGSPVPQRATVDRGGVVVTTGAGTVTWPTDGAATRVKDPR